MSFADQESGLARLGQITFSHPINMEWLEANFWEFFNVYKIVEGEYTNTEIDASSLKTETFEKEDGIIVDFSITDLADTDRLYIDVSMGEQEYSRYGNLFLHDGTSTI